MIKRMRHELIELLGLVLSIRLSPAPRHASPEALAAACAVDPSLVHRIEEIGLLRSEPSRPGRAYDADDARVTAIIAELLDLGATDDDIGAFGERLLQRCGKCGSSPCPTRCDAIDVLAEMLRRIAARLRAGEAPRGRVARIERAIASIDALADLI